VESEVIRLAANPEDAQRLHWGTWAASGALLLALLLTMVLGITCGAVHVPLPSIAAWFTHTRPLSEDERVILMEIRLPRIIAGAMVGGRVVGCWSVVSRAVPQSAC
jgi:iron complex transport system permease protein